MKIVQKDFIGMKLMGNVNLVQLIVNLVRENIHVKYVLKELIFLKEYVLIIAE